MTTQQKPGAEKDEARELDIWTQEIVEQMRRNFAGHHIPHSAVRHWLDRAYEAGRLAGLEQAAKINTVLLEALKRILAEAESWHKETGHEDDDPIIQCDGICACIPQMQAAIREAEGMSK